MATYSKSLTVAAKSAYTLTMNNIPTGSSVTPVNDIQTWLHCADIWSKTYTTINQVLADASTLQALIASTNAADYMVRSTNWASSVCANATAMGYIGNNDYCANKLLSNSTWSTAICNSTYFESVLNVKVPTMTGNTTPSGEAFASGAWNNNYPYYAFDNNTSTGAATSERPTTADYCGYDFGSSVLVKKWAILVNSVGRCNGVAVEGSNSKTSGYTTIQTFDTSALNGTVQGNTTPTVYNITNNNKYRYYRARYTNVSSLPQFMTLQFWGR